KQTRVGGRCWGNTEMSDWQQSGSEEKKKMKDITPLVGLPPQPISPAGVSRRGFLFTAGVALNAIAATLLAISVIGYVFSSFRRREPYDAWIPLGKVEPIIPAYPAEKELQKVSGLGLRLLADPKVLSVLQSPELHGRPIVLEGWLRVREGVLRVRSAHALAYAEPASLSGAGLPARRGQ